MSFCILLHVYTYVCHPERAVQIRTLNSTWQSEELKVEARSVTGGKEGSVTYSFGWPVRPTPSPSSLPSRPGPSGLISFMLFDHCMQYVGIKGSLLAARARREGIPEVFTMDGRPFRVWRPAL